MKAITLSPPEESEGLKPNDIDKESFDLIKWNKPNWGKVAWEIITLLHQEEDWRPFTTEEINNKNTLNELAAAGYLSYKNGKYEIEDSFLLKIARRRKPQPPFK